MAEGKKDFCVEAENPPSTARADKVCSLFVCDSKEWDEEKIRNLFCNHDARAILATRIPQNNPSDRLAWVHSNDGQYPVKTGYHYWYSQHTGVQQSNGWSKIGRLNIPHKLKIFLWRFCLNIGSVETTFLYVICCEGKGW